MQALQRNGSKIYLRLRFYRAKLNEVFLMADVIITLKIMPASPEVDLGKIEEVAKEKIKAFEGEVGKSEQIPVAFGLKSLNLIFVMDEKKGSTDKLEDEISDIEGVQSVEVTDVRRAIG